MDAAFPDQALFNWILKRGGTFRKLKDTLEPNPYRIAVNLKKQNMELNVNSGYVNKELYKIDDSITMGNGYDDSSMLLLLLLLLLLLGGG